MGGTVGCVNMVVSDGGGSNKLNTTAIEQVGIAASTSAHDECIGITHQSGIDVCSRGIYGIYTHRIQSLAYVGYLIVYNYFH